MRRILGIIILVILLDYSFSSVISCGGFVDTIDNLERSLIRVRLLTPEGHQKYEAECNPENGYFMIPVYKKGQYKIQVVPPNGWIYEKDTIEINVDGQNDICSKGIDIKFKHTGFTISGRVKSGEMGGPSGFKLGLYTLKGELISEAITDSNGNYVFNAVPGSYIVYNVDKDAQCIERGKVPVKVINSPIIVQPDITIMGHLLTVKVFDDLHKKLSGVKISLFSKKKLQLGGFESQHDHPVVTDADGGYYYSLKTNDGIADFSCLPFAEYKISASHKLQNVELTFEPKIISFTMKSKNAVVEFITNGFSTLGKVMIGENVVNGAKIYYDNKLIGETDRHGIYHLKDVQFGVHIIKATHNHYEFDVIKTELTPSLPHVPDLIAKKVSVCGKLKVEDGDVNNAKILIESTLNRYVVNVNSDGSFCTFVIPGKYKVKTENIPPVTPEFYNIDTTNEPTLNLVFTQFKAKVELSVNCFENCNDYTVSLNDNSGLVSQAIASTTVTFNDVVPGSYFLMISGNKPTCWDNEKIDINIEDKDIDGISFKQTGYKVKISSKYSSEVHYRHATRSTVNGIVKISNNEESFCVPASGEYLLTFNSCHKFTLSEMKLSIPTTETITLKPKTAQIIVSISASSLTSEKFQLLMSAENKNEQIYEEVSSSNNEHLFKFDIDMDNINSVLKFVPKSKEFLFKPEVLEFNFDGNCNMNDLKFVAEKGVFIQGSVNPPVDEVDVKAINKNNEKAEVLTTKTNKAGKYVIGPVAKDSHYELEVVKEGYKFIKNSENVYAAVKLSELRVSFIDGENRNLLEDVLVSISGVDNYRSNQIIGSSGKHNYIDLRPGDYYIVPVLQEYQFEKSPVKMSVKEGEVVSIVLEGKRYAWSAFGKVTYLNGRPVVDTKVEALSADCGNLYEDATTDDAGKFRIRGLKLGCSYRISPKITNNEFSLYPPYRKIIAERRDRVGIDFVMTTFKPTFELHGKLHFKDNDGQPPLIKVSLLKKNFVLQSTGVLAPFKSFIFVDDTIKTNDTITVVIEDVKTNRIYDVRKEFTVNELFTSLDFDVSLKQKAADIQITNNNYFGIAIISIIALCFLYPEKSRPIFDFIFQLLNSLKTITLENNQRSPENRRRK